MSFHNEPLAERGFLFKIFHCRGRREIQYRANQELPAQHIIRHLTYNLLCFKTEINTA